MSSPAPGRLSPVFDALLRGEDPGFGALAQLSSLDGDDLEFARGAWPALSPDARERLLLRANELAEDDATLDFVALARVALKDPSAAVRKRAVEALWETDDRRAARDLVALLEHDPDAAVREAAAESLTHFVILREFEDFDAGEGDAIIAALRGRIEDVAEDVDVRGGALEALGPRTLAWVDSLITNAYYHDAERLRLSAFRAMGASAHEKWLEYIYEGLSSEEPEVRFEAAQAAGLIASDEATEAVGALLDDEDSDVAFAAIRALGEISGPAAQQYLREFAARAPEGFELEVADAMEAATFNLGSRDQDDWA
ncbi:MAG: HEAT repeat domain-containing protein [Dehalococcoidia bacterium]